MFEVSEIYLMLVIFKICLGGLILFVLTLVLRKLNLRNIRIIWLKKTRVWHILTAVLTICVISFFAWSMLLEYVAKNYQKSIFRCLKSAEALDVTNSFSTMKGPRYLVEQKQVVSPDIIGKLVSYLRRTKFYLSPGIDLAIETRDIVDIRILSDKGQLARIKITGSYVFEAEVDGKSRAFWCEDKQLATEVRSVLSMRDNE